MRKNEKVSKSDTENGGRTPSPSARCAATSPKGRGKWGGKVGGGKLRERISDLLLLLGAAMLVLGAFLIWLPAGFFMAGGVLLLLGWLVGAEESGGGDTD